MEQKMNLKKLEKNTAAVVFQTGIVEIGIGLIWVVSSLAMIFDDISYYIDILFIVPVIFIILGTRYIASPRMGVVKFARKRMRRNTWFIVTVTAFLVIMVTVVRLVMSRNALQSVTKLGFSFPSLRMGLWHKNCIIYYYPYF